MKITICGSMVFANEMKEAMDRLHELGHEVKMPPMLIKKKDGGMMTAQEAHTMRHAAAEDDEWVWDLKERAIRLHFDKVEWSDAILVLNYTKRDVINYIGANTFLEMGLAFHLNKLIYLLNPIPDIDCKEELLGMKPIVINGELRAIYGR